MHSRVHQSTSGNSFNGEAAKAFAAAVLAHETIEEFCAIPLTDWRKNKTYSEPDFSELGLRSTEGHVLAALLPVAWKVQAVTLDGRPLPVHKFRGGTPTNEVARARIEKAALSLLLASTPAQQELMKEEAAADGAREGDGGAIKALESTYDEKPEAEINLTKLNLGIASAVVMSSLISSSTTLFTLNLSCAPHHTALGHVLVRPLSYRPWSRPRAPPIIPPLVTSSLSLSLSPPHYSLDDTWQVQLSRYGRGDGAC